MGRYSQDEKNIKLNYVNVTEDNYREIDLIVNNPETLKALMEKVKTVTDAETATEFLNQRLTKFKENNEQSAMTSAFIHEKGHMEADKAGIYFRQMSPEQSGKSVMNDEIAANMRELVNQRKNWLQNGGDINKMDEYFHPNFKFYADAVKNGDVKPTSKKRIEQRKEQSLMINGTQNTWCKNFSEIYSEQIGNVVGERISGGHIDDFRANDRNYKKAKEECFTIGMDGEQVNFDKYLKQDVSLPQSAKEAIDNSVQRQHASVTPEMLDILKGQKFSSPKDLDTFKAKQILKLRGSYKNSASQTPVTPRDLQLMPSMFKSLEK